METVPSPCQRMCVVKGDYCEGCGRSLDEISAWRLMNNAEKQAVWERLEKQALKRSSEE